MSKIKLKKLKTEPRLQLPDEALLYFSMGFLFYYRCRKINKSEAYLMAVLTGN